MPPTPDEFGISTKWSVKLDGPSMAEEVHFQECVGLDAYIQVEEVAQGGKNDGNVKLPGQARFSNLVFKRGLTKSTKFFEWVNKCISAGGNEAPKIERCSGKVSLLNRDGSPMLTWNFTKAWPCRYEGPGLDTASGRLALETLELAHEGLTLEAGTGGPVAQQAKAQAQAWAWA